MKIQVLECNLKNSGKLSLVNDRFVEIKKGRFLELGTSHPLYSENEKYFKRVYCFEYLKKRIYFFNRFGQKDSNSGFHVGFTWFQHQQFLLLQNRHWIQKEENIRYIVNLIFLIIGVYLGFQKLK